MFLARNRTMALVEIARFADMNEAQVAGSALRAAGFHPVLPDEHVASVVWTDQFAIGGIRLSVPGREAADARDFITEVRASDRYRAVTAEDERRETAVGVASVLFASMLFGWPLARLKRPGRPMKAVAVVLMALTVAMWLARLLPHAPN